MAVSELSLAQLGAAHRSAARLLFERLPDRLFAPLASPNRHQYWALLCRLHAKRFGPDAPLPPSHGFVLRDVMQDIEDELVTQDAWENEDGNTPDTPLAIRANAVFNRLLESGWFRLERHGVEKRLTMRPTVSQFLTLLVSFAETGPVFVSGKIRSIELNIQQVMEGRADGDTLAETAEQARNLLEHVRNTGTNIRDIMELLAESATTAQYVQGFFGDYIEKVFIGDYGQLKKREHPLSRKAQILRIVEELHASEDQRARLITWYETKRCPGNRIRAEQLFEKDIQRLLELRRIDEFLDRLDEEIRRANRRALAFLDYRLRSLRPVDHLISKAIAAATGNWTLVLGDPFPSGDMVSGEHLAEPRKAKEPSVPSNLRRQIPSESQLARSRLMLRARDARSVTPPLLTAYVLAQLNGARRIDSEGLSPQSLTDVRYLQSLSTVGLAMSANSRRLYLSAMTLARGFRVGMREEPEAQSAWISGRPFVVELRQPADAAAKETRK